MSLATQCSKRKNPRFAVFSVQHPERSSKAAAMSWRVVAALLLPLAAAAGVEEVTSEAQFKKILSDNPAVVVDFYSCAASVCTGAARTARGRACASPPRGRRQTCGPCIMMAPIFKEVAREYEGRLKLIKVDVQRSYVGVQAPGRQQRLPACASPTPCRRLSTASSRRRLSPPPLRRRPRRLRPNRPGRRHSPAARALCPCSRVLFTQPERLPSPTRPRPPRPPPRRRSGRCPPSTSTSTVSRARLRTSSRNLL